jgi:hypothetical protein
MTELEEAVLQGRPFKPTCATTVTGDDLRNLFFGKRSDGKALREGEGGGGCLTPAGIVIDGGAEKLVTLVAGTKGRESTIDLSNLAAMDGGPLPSLAFHGCIISADLLLTGSHFAFVSITNCEIVRLDGDHCKIDTHCRLTYLTAATPEAGNHEIAQIRLVGAQIGGSADLRGCQLQGPPAERWPAASARGYADRFALSLASATIDGRLLLDDGFTALGGVSLYQATIGNSLSLRTARLESRDPRIPALDAEEMRLSGSLVWADPRTGLGGSGDWKVAGRVVLERAQIGGDCIFANCRWADTGARSLAAGGGLVNHISGGIDARLCHIRGQLSVGAGCSLARWDAPPPGRMEEHRIPGLFGPSLDAWKIHVEKGVRIENGADFSGPVLFNCSYIDHELVFRGKIELPLPPVAVTRMPEALDLSGARIGGLVRIMGEFSGVVSMQRTTVDGAVELQEIKFSCPPLVPSNAEADRKGGHASILDLSSANISGTLHVGRLELNWRHPNPQPLAALIGETTRPPVVGVSGKQIGRQLALDYFLGDGTRATVISTASGPQLFEGGFEQFRSLCSPMAPITTEFEAERYLRAYFDNVIGEFGPTRSLTVQEIKQDGPDWVMAGCEFISGERWYRANLRIHPDGRLSSSNDRQIARSDPIPTGSWRVGPFRLGATPPTSTSLPDTRCSRWFEAAVRRYFADRQLRPVLIDLRGLHCRAFGDNDALPWEQLGRQRYWRLLLDGINFTQFDRTDPKERTKRVPIGGTSRPAAATAAGRPAISSIGLGMRRTRMLQSYEDRSKVRGWQGLEALAGSTEYSPQPFETFARAYSQGGDHDVALAIVKAQKRLQWKRAQLEGRKSIRQRRSRIITFVALYALVIVTASAMFLFPPMGFAALLGLFVLALLLLFAGFLALAFMWPNVHILIGKLFDASFGFGLKPRRAMVTFALCLIGGTIGTYAVEESLVPVASVPGKLSAASSDDDRQGTRLATAVQGCNVVDDSVADRFLYAFDVFVPLIDVRQECAFSIDEKAGWVRALRTFYAALGWLVVSLSLLTFSGVLRRDVER